MKTEQPAIDPCNWTSFGASLGHQPAGSTVQVGLSGESYQALIDACAANQVSIELNANLDQLVILPYARDKGVLISINPDAHNVGAIPIWITGSWQPGKG